MNYILYLIIVGIVFCSGAIFCPNTIIVYDGFSFVMAIAIYSFTSAYLAILIKSSLTSLIAEKPNKNDTVTITVVSSIITLLTSLLSVIAVETVIPNFEIMGFYPKCIIAFITTISISMINYFSFSRQ